MIHLDRPNPGATEEELTGFERLLNVVLPSDYRAFVAQHEGGYAASSAFDFPDGSNGAILNTFFTLSEIVEELRAAEVESARGRLPANVLPIAYTGTGNLVCLNTVDGSIWFVDHELALDAPGGFVRLAGSFAKFDDIVEHVEPAPFDPETSDDEDEHINVEWARANPTFFSDEYRAAHPEIFG